MVPRSSCIRRSWGYLSGCNSSFAEVCFRARYEAPEVKSLRNMGVDLYRQRATLFERCAVAFAGRRSSLGVLAQRFARQHPIVGGTVTALRLHFAGRERTATAETRSTIEVARFLKHVC